MFWKRLVMGLQPSIYIPAAKSVGYDVIGALYDVLRKPDLHPLKATPLESRKYTKPTKKEPASRLYADQREVDETPEEYGARCLAAIMVDPDKFYQRATIVRLEADRRESAQDVWQTAQTIRDARRLKLYPRHPDSCVQWSRVCDYFSVCAGEASIDDPVLFARQEKKHAELDASPDGLELLSQSSLGAFRSCPRKYYYRYELQVRPLRPAAEPLRLGTSIHRALEEFWRSGDVQAAIGKLDTKDLYSRAKEHAMFVGYVARWNKPTGVLAVEKEWQMDLVNPETGAKSRSFRLGGRIDAIAEVE